MKQPSLLFSLLVMAAAPAFSQSLDLRSLSEIRQYKLMKALPESSKAKRMMRQISENPRNDKQAFDAVAQLQDNAIPETTIAFIRIAEGFTADDLSANGIEIRSVYGDIAIAKVRMDEAEAIADIECVKHLQLQRQLYTNMDIARAEQGVDLIHHGSSEAGLTVPYTGKGVITGIVDQGVDPHHINFRYSDGQSRIEALWHWRMNTQGQPVSNFYNYTNIGDFITDTEQTYHGTHTLGIMSGSYNGPVTVAKPWADPTVREPATYITENCKYYGVAPQASIAVSCGDLQDGFIAYGMEDILNFAEWMRENDTRYKWPLVWNLSLGSNQGPHDKRTMLNTVLNMLGTKGIICISAGNEGDLKIALKKTFAEGDTRVKTMIYPYGYQYDPSKPESFTARQGSIAIYSDDDTPFELQAVIYNKKRGYREAKRMPVIGDNIGTYYCSSKDYQMEDTDVVGDATFCKAFDGYVGVGRLVDTETGRYYGMVDYSVINNKETNLNDDYVLGFEVIGKPGHKIECYGDAQNTWMDNYGVEGFTDGSTDGSISDIAVADNVIAVGSYNTRNQWTCLDGGTAHYEGDAFKVGGISGFSSYGTLSDGRELPLVCAPGSAIISSVSYPFAKIVKQEYGEEYLNFMCQAKLVEEKRVNYWKQEVGTSMSTPFVAGSIALWLEANPDLDVNDVKEIIRKTAVRDDDVNNTKEQKRWGAGKFNALAGLKEAIRMAGIPGITTDTNNDRLILTREGDRRYKAFVGNADEMDARVYTADGRLVMHRSGAGDELDLDFTGMNAGIYIINVNGHHSSRIIVK